MSIDRPFQGSLFAGDFLGDLIAESDDWQSFDDGSLDGLEAALRRIFDHLVARCASTAGYRIDKRPVTNYPRAGVRP